MSNVSIASTDGFKFENLLYDELKKNFTDGFIIRREKDVKEEYGSNVTALDFEIFNVVRTKDINKIPHKHVFIQLKWRDSRSSINDINHFIQCCNNIITAKNLNVDNIYHIYGTKVPISRPSLEALKDLKLSENIYVSDMKNCVFTIVNKILAFYGKPQIEQIIEFIDIYDDNTDYTNLTKAILKQIICKRYNLKESNLRRLKHQNLVDIIVSKNVKVTPVGTTVTNNNILEVIEYLSETKTNNEILEGVKYLSETVTNNEILEGIEYLPETVTNNNILEVIEYLSDTKTNNKILEVVKDLPEIVEENLIILDEKNMTLEYEEPEKRNDNEVKSKLLKIGSELHTHLTKLKNLLDRKGFKHGGHNMGLHTEVLNQRESLETYLSRVAALEGRIFNIKDPNNYDIIGRAIVFLVGELEGYEKDAKITIAFLDDKKYNQEDRKKALQIIYDNI